MSGMFSLWRSLVNGAEEGTRGACDAEGVRGKGLRFRAAV